MLGKKRLLASWLFKKSISNYSHSDTAYLSDTSYHRTLYEGQAYVLLKQFDRIESFFAKRREIYKRYHNSIQNPLIVHTDTNPSGVFIRFPIFVSDRNRFLKYCDQNHIAVGTGYNRLYCAGDQSVAHEISKKIVYLPFGNDYSDKKIEKVISVVNSFK